MVQSKDGQEFQKKTIVTIGVCVRNCENTIKHAIDSIIQQDFPKEFMEIIFVDDGSTDKTLDIIKNYFDFRKIGVSVRIFQHNWRGLGASRNVVVKNAYGKYIIWVDGDMIIPEDHVRKQVEFMEKNPKVGIGKARHEFPHDGKLLETLESIPFAVLDLKNESLNSKLPGTGGSIFRVEAVRQVGGFDEDMAGVGEDQDIAFRIKAIGWRIERTSASFFEIRERNWKDLWNKYVWYGYGNYKLYCKNRRIFNPIRMTPLAGFLAGILLCVDAYRLKLKVRKVYLLLLPFHFLLKMTAWCWGFFKSKIDSMAFKEHTAVNIAKFYENTKWK